VPFPRFGMSSRIPPTSTGQSAVRADRAASTPPAVPGKFSLSQLARFGAVGVQLGFLALIIRTFDIESAAFFRVMEVACAGFVLNHFAPSRLRLPVFALLSLFGIYWVMGPANAVQIIALGLVLIGLAHL